MMTHAKRRGNGILLSRGGEAFRHLAMTYCWTISGLCIPTNAPTDRGKERLTEREIFLLSIFFSEIGSGADGTPPLAGGRWHRFGLLASSIWDPFPGLGSLSSVVIGSRRLARAGDRGPDT